jgi:hypothetical protein
MAELSKHARYRAKVRRAAIAVMGGRCQRCGFDDCRALQFDHIKPVLRGLNGMLADLHVELIEDIKDKPETLREVEGMALQPHEHYDYLVVLATTTQEWNVLCERLGLEPQARRHGRMGTCRAIRASKLLEVVPVAEVKAKPKKGKAA